MNSCWIYSNPQGNSDPVYRIDGRYYKITTLELCNSDRWEEQALFRIPLDLNHQWITMPILIETFHGSIVAQLEGDEVLTLGRPSTQRALDSPVKNLHLMMIPRVQGEEIDLLRLKYPNRFGWSILKNLFRFGITLNEFFGRSPIKEDGRKVSSDTIVQMHKQKEIRGIKAVPETDGCRKGNIIIVVTDPMGNKLATVLRHDPIKRDFLDPIRMDF